MNTCTNKCCYHWSNIWHVSKRVKFQNQVVAVAKSWSLSCESASVGKNFFNGCSWSVCNLVHLLSSTFFLARDRGFYVLKNLQKKIKCLTNLCLYKFYTIVNRLHTWLFTYFININMFLDEMGEYIFSPFQMACLHWWNLGIEERLPLSYINSVYIWFSMNCEVLLIITQRKTFSLSRYLNRCKPLKKVGRLKGFAERFSSTSLFLAFTDSWDMKYSGIHFPLSERNRLSWKPSIRQETLLWLLI